MICYALICDQDHSFEGWFGGSADFDVQQADGLLSCPVCGSQTVEKAIMAPAVKTAKGSDKAKWMNDIAAKIRDDIAANCDDVGTNFAEEARKIHYGETPARGIYGAATPADSKALNDEGITAVPLPDILVPKPPKTKLN